MATDVLNMFKKEEQSEPFLSPVDRLAEFASTIEPPVMRQGEGFVGMGHRVSDEEQARGTIIIQGRAVLVDKIEHEDALLLLGQDLFETRQGTKAQFDSISPQGMAWDHIDRAYQDLLVMVMWERGSIINGKNLYNPELSKAILKEDDEAVRAAVVLSYRNEDGSKVYLVEKSKTLTDHFLGVPIVPEEEAEEPEEQQQETQSVDVEEVEVYEGEDGQYYVLEKGELVPYGS